MKKFYLIRHAQSEANVGLHLRPNHEIALTELGKRQAVELSDWLYDTAPSPDTVFVSSYIRTHETARPYLDKIGAKPVQIDDLREFNHLDFHHVKDLAFADVVHMANEFWQRADCDYVDSPATDSFNNLVERVRTVRDEFERLPDGNYVVFTHGMWLGMLMWQLIHHDSPRLYNMVKFREFELSVRPKNCEVFMLMLDGKHSGISKVRVRGGE